MIKELYSGGSDMNNKVADKIYKEILDTLLDQTFLKEYHVKKNILLKHVKTSNFANDLYYMLNKNDFSCSAVFSLLEKTLKELWSEKTPEDPLKYIYQFVLNLSFPDSVEINLNT